MEEAKKEEEWRKEEGKNEEFLKENIGRTG